LSIEQSLGAGTVVVVVVVDGSTGLVVVEIGGAVVGATDGGTVVELVGVQPVISKRTAMAVAACLGVALRLTFTGQQ
jgi:hypothetical protein